VHAPEHEVHPQASARVNFRTVFAWWLRFGGIFTRSLRAMTKKGRQLFLEKSEPPQTKFWLRLCSISNISLLYARSRGGVLHLVYSIGVVDEGCG